MVNKNETIEELVTKGVKNIFVTGEKGSGKRKCVENFIISSKEYDRVIRVTYDKEKYLMFGKDKNLTLDVILKNALIRNMIDDDGCCKNYLFEFEKSLTAKTLVVIYNFDIPSPTPYMHHLFELPATFIVVSNTKIGVLPDNCKGIYVSDGQTKELSVDTLDKYEKELLYSICALTYFLQEDTKIISSKAGVFDKSSVEFYLPRLVKHLDSLEQKGFVIKDKNGYISVNRHLSKHVLYDKGLEAEDLPNLNSYFDSVFDFKIRQDAKDVEAEIKIVGPSSSGIVTSDELRQTYMYFSTIDKQRILRIYNLILPMCLEEKSINKFRNFDYYSKNLFDNIDSIFNEIYDRDLYTTPNCVDLYTKNVLGLLDEVRVCVCAMANITADMYKSKTGIFQMLYDAMESIYKYAVDENTPVKTKMAVLDDVLRLTTETFSYCFAVVNKRDYNPARDSAVCTRIRYTGIPDLDYSSAVSLVFGYSPLTMKLYGVYNKCLGEWLELDKNYSVKQNDELKNQLQREKKTVRVKALSDISMQYHRIISGYENYFDFFSKKYSNTDVEKELLSIDNLVLEKRLLDNERFVRRGFDRGTKKGSREYAKNVMSVLKKCKDPINHIMLIFDPEYPLGDETYKYLVEYGFIEFVLNSVKITNLDRQDLHIILLQNYVEAYESSHKKGIYEDLIEVLETQTKPTMTYKKKLFFSAQGELVKSILVNGKDSECYRYVFGKYDKYYLSDERSRNSTAIISEAVYCEYTGAEPKEKNRMFDAFESLIMEYASVCIEYDKSNLFSLAKSMLGKREVEKLKELYDSIYDEKNE